MNVQPPDVSSEVLELGLGVATVLKVNGGELEVVAALLGFAPVPESYFAAAPSLEWLCITRGEEGAELYARSGETWAIERISLDVVDTVGAGDAFTAGLARRACARARRRAGAAGGAGGCGVRPHPPRRTPGPARHLRGTTDTGTGSERRELPRRPHRAPVRSAGRRARSFVSLAALTHRAQGRSVSPARDRPAWPRSYGERGG